MVAGTGVAVAGSEVQLAESREQQLGVGMGISWMSQAAGHEDQPESEQLMKGLSGSEEQEQLRDCFSIAQQEER